MPDDEWPLDFEPDEPEEPLPGLEPDYEDEPTTAQDTGPDWDAIDRATGEWGAELEGATAGQTWSNDELDRWFTDDYGGADRFAADQRLAAGGKATDEAAAAIQRVADSFENLDTPGFGWATSVEWARLPIETKIAYRTHVEARGMFGAMTLGAYLSSLFSRVPVRIGTAVVMVGAAAFAVYQITVPGTDAAAPTTAGSSAGTSSVSATASTPAPQAGTTATAAPEQTVTTCVSDGCDSLGDHVPPDTAGQHDPATSAGSDLRSVAAGRAPDGSRYEYQIVVDGDGEEVSGAATTEDYAVRIDVTTDDGAFSIELRWQAGVEAPPVVRDGEGDSVETAVVEWDWSSESLLYVVVHDSGTTGFAESAHVTLDVQAWLADGISATRYRDEADA